MTRLERLVPMRCPYDADICGSPATLEEFDKDGYGWIGVLVCLAGHRFKIGQDGSPVDDDDRLLSG